MASTRSEDGGSASALTKRGAKKVMKYKMGRYVPKKVGATSPPAKKRRYPLNSQTS